MREQGTQGVNEFLAPIAESQRFLVRLESKGRLLMNAPTRETLEKLIRTPPAIKRGRQKKTEEGHAEPKTNQSREEIAAQQIYRDEQDRICFPMANLYACLREAGTEIPWGAKSSKLAVTSKRGQTMVFSFLEIHSSEFLALTDLDDGGVNNEGWTVDIRKGKKFDKKAKPVTIIRPLFTRWAMEFEVTIHFIGPEVTLKMVLDLLTLAGNEFGIGAFRPGLNRANPAKRGNFGTFRLARFEPISERQVATG